MTRQQLITEYERVNRKFEAKYFPKVRKAIRVKVNDTVIKLKSGGIEYAKTWLSSDIGNEYLADVVTDLYREVGLRHARMNYSRMLNENGRKGHVAGMEVKGFGPYERSTLCPHCGKATNDVESGMGYIVCSNCGGTFSSQKSMEVKGFGFNEIWTNFILKYFQQYLLEKITYEVAATTRGALLLILSQATTEGWSIDQTVDKVQGWDERYQAARVVRTETNRAANVGAKANSETLSYQQQKEWVSAKDFRVRGNKPKEHANHVKLNGTKIDAEDKFVDSVNGDRMDFPGDITASAASVIFCRCLAVYTAKRDANGNLIPKRKTTFVQFPGNNPVRETVLI